MGFLKADLSTVGLVEGVFPWLVPSDEDVRRSDAAAHAAGNLALEKVLHEFFLLKAAVILEYGLGLLETLGMRKEGMEQFHAVFVQRLAEGLVGAFPSNREAAVGLLASRLKTYDQALHGDHPEDPHLGLADAFTRFCGAPDDPGLVRLCLDTCKDIHARFIKELSDLGLAAKDKP